MKSFKNENNVPPWDAKHLSVVEIPDADPAVVVPDVGIVAATQHHGRIGNHEVSNGSYLNLVGDDGRGRRVQELSRCRDRDKVVVGYIPFDCLQYMIGRVPFTSS